MDMLIGNDAAEGIILIGHSIGGMVARTAVLMSSHPRCKVHSIILLSSPNLSPPYPLDMNLHRIYSKVNHAWLNSYYNDSQACMEAHRKHVEWSTHPSTPTSPTPSSISIGINYECSVCVSRIKVISLTGGSIDELVNEHKTALDFGPVPINRTIVQSSSKKTSTSDLIFAPVHNLIFTIRYLATKVHYLFYPLPANTTMNITYESSNQTIAPNPLNSSSSHPWDDITQDQWHQHMRDFIPPQHYHVHTIQLKQVGFMVDHLAMVWCHQVLDTVTRLMEKLTNLNDSMYVNQLLPIKHSFEFNISRNTLPQIQYLQYRNHTSSIHQLLQRAEYDSMYSKTGSVIVTMAVLFLTSYANVILNVFLSISCLIMAVHFINGLSNAKDQAYPSPWLSTSPWQHSPLRHMYAPLSHFISRLIGYKAYKDSMHWLGSVAVIVCSGLAYRMYVDSLNPALFVQNYSPYVFAIMAYNSALMLRVVLLTLVTTLRTIVTASTTAIYAIFRRFIITKSVRKSLKGPTKFLRNGIFPVIEENALLLVFGMILLNVRIFQVGVSPLTTTAYAFSVYLISIYLLSLFTYLKVVFFTSTGNASQWAKETDQILFFFADFHHDIPSSLPCHRSMSGLDRVKF